MVAVNDAAEPRWTRVCRADELELDKPLGRVVEGGPAGQPVCVIAHAGRLMAIVDRCPHRDIALSGGIVRGGELVCPGHFWRFDLRSGRRVDEPATTLSPYPSRVVNGWVEALIPAAEPVVSMRNSLLAAAKGREAEAGAGTDERRPWPDRRAPT